MKLFPATLFAGLVPFALYNRSRNCGGGAILHLVGFVPIDGSSDTRARFSSGIQSWGRVRHALSALPRDGGSNARIFVGYLDAIFVDKSTTTARSSGDVSSLFWGRLGGCRIGSLANATVR